MNKIHSLVLGGALATVAALPVQADTIFGVYAGGQLWNADGSGQIGSKGSSLSGDFDFGSDAQNVVYLAIEHPVPLVPNVKIKRTALESTGSSTSAFTFNGQAYSGAIASDTDFTHTDLVLYYEILDNWVNLDVGLNVMQFDGHVAVSDDQGSATQRVDFSGYLPTLYAAVGFDLPLTGLSLNGEFAGIAVGDSSFVDYQAEIAYSFIDNMVVDLTAQLGYRKTTLELDDLDDINSNIDFSGPYVGLEVHF